MLSPENRWIEGSWWRSLITGEDMLDVDVVGVVVVVVVLVVEIGGEKESS